MPKTYYTDYQLYIITPPDGIIIDIISIETGTANDT